MNSPVSLHNRKRARQDRFVRYLVSTFGWMVLLTLLVLIAHLISQALPLAYVPQFSLESRYALPPGASHARSGDIANGEPALVQQQCQITFMRPSDNQLVKDSGYHRPCEYALKTLRYMGQNYVADMSPSGQLRVIAARQLVRSAQQPPDEAPILTEPQQGAMMLSFALDPETWAQTQDWSVALSSRWAVVSQSTKRGTALRWVDVKTPTNVTDQHFSADNKVLPLAANGITAVARGNGLRFVDQAGGVQEASMSAPLRWWKSLPKDRTLLIATQDHLLTRWILTNQQGKFTYRPTWSVPLPEGAQPLDVSAHASMNAIALLLDNGSVRLYNRISGEKVATQAVSEQSRSAGWHGNRLYTYSDSQIDIWRVRHLSGVTTWASLFGEQQYEGYTEKTVVWQTTSATDYQEAKYSITPLLIGSLKASLIALMIAIPVSVGAAVYTAYFARSRSRHVIRPAIEMLEAIPSVLIGFIAAIWLTPLAEQLLFTFAFFLITVPFLLILVAMVQHRIARRLPGIFRHGTEIALSLLGIVLLGYISMSIAPAGVAALFGPDGMASLSSGADTPVGKATLVVAIALGLAISPGIYSLAEDAISGVPQSLKQASFALGATRLQTLQRVVLHVALPGILAAIMLGFGRAFGETMIVLMVTGNTPVASWNLFEGLRALTANLAIELPEADPDSAHYQILFLTAGLLFLFTFVVNTIAEWFRQRLRRKVYHA